MFNTEVTKHAFYFQIHDIKPVFNVSWYYLLQMTFLFLYELLCIYQVLMYPGHNAVVYFK